MPIVTVVKSLPSAPTNEVAKQQMRFYVAELFELWSKHVGRFIAGKRFYVMAFPPGAYAPSKSGVIRDATAFVKAPGTVPWAFAITDEKPPRGTPREYGLWTFDPDPDFFPDGV